MEIERLKLKRLNNTRDLGGFLGADGKRVKSGKLVRSGRLYNLPKSSAEKLKKLGVTTVVDLRTDRERLEYPCRPIDGVRHVHLPLVCTATPGITYSKSMAKVMREEGKKISREFGTADNYMKCMYDVILFDEQSRSRIREFFDILLAENGCVVWHCNAGKDRTGLIAMLTLGILGVDRSDIVKDYTMSDKFQRLKRAPQRILLKIVPMPPSFRNILLAMMKAKPEYIENAIDSVLKKYSSFEDYFVRGLGFDQGSVAKLREKYLE